MLIISDGGLRSLHPFPPAPLAHCIFEHVYFARPDSYVFGRSVNEVRTELGRHPGATNRASTPTSSVRFPTRACARATGFAEASGIPMAMGLIRNHYVGRTFIQPQQAIRHFSVRIKLNPVRSVLEGRRVDPDRRLDRARDDEPEDREDGARRGREGSAPADQLSADGFAVLLRRRHAEQVRADRRDAQPRPDARLHRGRQPGLPEPRRAAARRRRPTAARTAPPATPASIRWRFRETSRRTCSSR